jgi:hypothetical protein
MNEQDRFEGTASESDTSLCTFPMQACSSHHGATRRCPCAYVLLNLTPFRHAQRIHMLRRETWLPHIEPTRLGICRLQGRAPRLYGKGRTPYSGYQKF